jgi:hypothetical protein
LRDGDQINTIHCISGTKKKDKKGKAFHTVMQADDYKCFFQLWKQSVLSAAGENRNSLLSKITTTGHSQKCIKFKLTISPLGGDTTVYYN